MRSCHSTKKAKAAIQINHGLTEHSGRYEHFMQYLARHGYHSFAHDHRGHGLTQAEKLPRGQFSQKDGARKIIKDVDFMMAHIQSEHEGLPILIFGHSMGGLIAMNYAQYKPHMISGLAIWNSNFQAANLAPLSQIIMGVEQFFLGSDVPSPTMSYMTFAKWAKSIDGATSSKDWLTSDKDMVEAFGDDDLAGFAPAISMWQDVMHLTARGAHPHGLSNLPIDLPIQLVAGGKDPATDYGKAKEWLANQLRATGRTNLDYKLFLNSRHETLNEVMRDDAMEHFVSWADKVIGA